MRVCVLLNQQAGSSDSWNAILEQIRVRNWTALETTCPEEFAAAVVEAAQAGFDRLVIAGGDGTIHAAVNALRPSTTLALAVLPLGTGNDWARTLALPLDALQAMDLVETGRMRTLDSFRVEGEFARRLVNAATGGFAGQVAENLTAERKAAWGPLAYLREASAVAMDPPRWTVTARFDGEPPQTLETINVVVANGRTAGGGIPIAPTANPEDGKIDVLLVRAGNAFDRTVITARILAGEYDRDETVLHRRVRRFELVSVPAMPFSFDGEETSVSHLIIRIEPRSFRFVVGPEYHRHGQRRVGVSGHVFGFFGALLRLYRRHPRWHPGLMAGILFCILGFVSVVLLRDHLRPWDDAVLRGMNERATPPATEVFVCFTRIGAGWWATIITIGIVAALAGFRRYLDAAILAVVMSAATVTSRLMKEIFVASRPEIFPHLHPAEGYSFPSTHAVAAVALYGTVAALCIRRQTFRGWIFAAAAFVFGFAIIVSRVYLGVHRPSESLAGICLGAGWVFAGAWLRGCYRDRSTSD